MLKFLDKGKMGNKCLIVIDQLSNFALLHWRSLKFFGVQTQSCFFPWTGSQTLKFQWKAINSRVNISRNYYDRE